MRNGKRHFGIYGDFVCLLSSGRGPRFWCVVYIRDRLADPQRHYTAIIRCSVICGIF